ncbi:2-keto-4-pentenoate hydratase [Mesonia sp. K7]|uniref:2-keto-4-pentenoate hydratase n=1 Tax=Mesonia sp. K7 TaxID=2218606 RepID=UPI000DA6EA81|nr:fumarylacetoacetate hydrolase family protein [Mesonia sp. K7]PZD76975.1 2-keto-4-pentenoate hydratase [Mesonia sp. K7]
MTLQQLADRIYQAEQNKVSCEPIRAHIGALDLESAYKIQEINIEKKKNSGLIERGKKIGLTSFKVQEQLGVDQPDFGILLNNMQFHASENITFAELMQPKAEAEIAFILKKDLDKENITEEEVVEAIDHAKIAVEIVGSRIKDWNIKITDTIADNASSSHFVLGEREVSLSEIDLQKNKMQLFVDGNLASEGDGTSCMGNPLNAVVWLANKMYELKNPLRKGEIILSGALGPMVNLQPNQKIKATIEGFDDLEFEVI